MTICFYSSCVTWDTYVASGQDGEPSPPYPPLPSPFHPSPPPPPNPSHSTPRSLCPSYPMGGAKLFWLLYPLHALPVKDYPGAPGTHSLRASVPSTSDPALSTKVPYFVSFPLIPPSPQFPFCFPTTLLLWSLCSLSFSASSVPIFFSPLLPSPPPNTLLSLVQR